jgi:hypothetical protein
MSGYTSKINDNLRSLTIMAREQSLLKKGKQFHKLVQYKLSLTADGHVKSEENVSLDVNDNKKGRVDIFVEEIGVNLVSIVEIKNTDWNKIKPENIQRNVKRQARQIWKYIEYQTDLVGKEVSPGIIFPKLPMDPERLKLIESIFEDEWIQVVWENESIDKVRQRMMDRSKSAQSEQRE